MSKTIFAGMTCAVLILSLSSSVWAESGTFLPQDAAEINTAKPAAMPAPAPQIKVNIPPAYVTPASPKAADMLRLSTGQSETITLKEDAASVIVANPSHATVFLDNARTLVVVPRAAGATNFKVLNSKGETILSQPILVNNTDNKEYIRVTRICGGTANCQASTTYYCPDNCVPVAVPQPESNVNYPTIPPIAALPPLPVDTSGGTN